MNNQGDIPFYTASFNSPVGTHTEFTLDHPEYIIFIKDGGNKNDPTSETTGLGKVFYVNDKSAFTSHQVAFIIKTNNVICKYLYLYLLSVKKDIMLLADYGTGLGYIQMPKIKNIVIPIPPLQIQQSIINKIVQLNEQTSHYEQYSKTLQTELELMNETISNLTLYSEEIKLDNPIETIRNNDIYDDTDKLIKSLKTKSLKIKKVECEVMDV
jgi:restriction endonuclease S subunit